MTSLDGPYAFWPFYELLIVDQDVFDNRRLFTNDFSGSATIFTTIDVVNIGGAEGNGFRLFVGSSGAGFHSAERGAGGHDSFPWRGQLSIQYQEHVDVEVDGGIWEIVATGFRCPDFTI